MTSRNLGNVVDYLRRIVNPWPGEASDHDLLAHFLATRDEAAFAALLKRHGPMVFGVSRRVLSRVHDAEDVVQATFLLLARKASTIRRHASVGCWLHGVARRLSIQLKRREMARLKRETRASATRAQCENPHIGDPEIQELLDTALQELPEKYRAALVLCYLEGQTQEEAARQLGCPLGTVRSRLARGRALLQKYLTRRGLTLSAAGLTTLVTVQIVSARLPTKLLASTIQAATQFASGTPLRGLVSASVAWLVQSGLKSAALAKLVWVSVGLVTMGVLAGGAGLAGRSGQAGEAEAAQVKEEARSQPKAIIKAANVVDENPRTDLLGDPLPAGALLRLGTTRFRHGNLVQNLAFSSDGKTLFSADGYGVYIWEARTGKLARRLGEHHNEWSLSHAYFAEDGTMALVGRQNIDIVETATGRVLHHFDTRRFTRAVLSPDGKTLVVYDNQGGKEAHVLSLFDVASGAERSKLLGHQDQIHGIIFSKDSKTLITSSDDKSIRFWDVGTGKLIRRLDHTTLVGSIALAPDAKTLASVDMTKHEYKNDKLTSIAWFTSKHVVIWDLGTNKVAYHLEPAKEVKTADFPWGHQINSIAFSHDSKILASSDRQGTHLWDLTKSKELPKRDLPFEGATALAFSFDGSTLATGGSGIVQLWDVATGKAKYPVAGHRSWVQAVALSPDGRTIATGGSGDGICLWDAATAKKTQVIGRDLRISSLDFALGGRVLISSNYLEDEFVRIWDVATGKERSRMPYGHFAVSPNGKMLAIYSEDKAPPISSSNNGSKTKPQRSYLAVWDIATGKQIKKWSLDHNDNSPLAFSSDSKLIYSWAPDYKVRLWDVATGTELRRLKVVLLPDEYHAPGQKDMIFRSAFSADHKLVAIANQTGQIAVYDLTDGKQVTLLRTKFGSLSATAFSPDNRQLAASHWEDKNVHLWEIASSQEYQQLPGHNGRILSLAYSSDGKRLVSGNTDTTALVWDLTGTSTQPKPQLLTAQNQENAWSDLSSADAVRGQKAVRTLLAVPDQTVALLAKKLKPATIPDANVLARCLANLDSGLFKTREEAMRELENMGAMAAPALRKALAGTPSLELKNRLEALLERFSTSQRLRILRAVQVLEQVGIPSSQALLKRLAAGVDSLLTREAKAAVERLARLEAAKNDPF